MKTRKHLMKSAIAISCFSVLTSCSFLRKETIIHGVVIDQSSESYVEGIPVILLEEELGAAPFSSVGYTLIAETTTDSEGRFFFQEDLKNLRGLYLVKALTQDGMFFNHLWHRDEFEKVHEESWVQPGIEQSMVLPLVSYGSYLITARNNSEIDSLEFDLTAIGSKYEHRAYYEVLDAEEEYTSSFEQLLPSGATKLSWNLSAPNFDTVIYDSIYVTPHEKRELTFTFEG